MKIKYFLLCNDCGHRKDTEAYDYFKGKNIDEMSNMIDKFKCSECASKKISIVGKDDLHILLPAIPAVLEKQIEKDKEKIVKYVATDNSENKVFHRPNCKWVRFVKDGAYMEFGDKEEPIKLGLRPCHACNP